MEPILQDGYIIVVDERQTDKKKLHGKMIVAHHEKFGLIVSRFWHIKHSDLLIRESQSRSVSLHAAVAHRWKGSVVDRGISGRLGRAR
jgi:hypothetical protein